MFIDLNCAWGRVMVPVLLEMMRTMPLISSANMLGFHMAIWYIAPDYQTGATNEVAIAHLLSGPAGFGRREMQLNPQEIYDNVLYQLGGLKHLRAGGKLHHKTTAHYIIAQLMPNKLAILHRLLF
jgi:UPF0271 protein